MGRRKKPGPKPRPKMFCQMVGCRERIPSCYGPKKKALPGGKEYCAKCIRGIEKRKITVMEASLARKALQESPIKHGRGTPIDRQVVIGNRRHVTRKFSSD